MILKQRLWEWRSLARRSDSGGTSGFARFDSDGVCDGGRWSRNRFRCCDPDQARWQADFAERRSGHVGFAPENPLQVELLAGLANEFGRVSDERLVSGSGLVNIYQFLAARSQTASERFEAATIFSRVETDQIAQQSVALFFELLGQVAGNFVLATGSFDGLFIAGGIVQRYPELLTAVFRAGFENKGRHRGLMQASRRYGSSSLAGTSGARLQRLALSQIPGSAASGRCLPVVPPTHCWLLGPVLDNFGF